MKHAFSIKYDGGIDKLVIDISDLRYDVLTEFLDALASKIRADSEADRTRGRVALSLDLEKASECLSDAASAIDSAWSICKKHMVPDEISDLRQASNDIKDVQVQLPETPV